MSVSQLQDVFLRELAETFAATRRRIVQRLEGIAPADVAARDAVVLEEMRGLYHGALVIFDGGTSLADRGLISIVDEDGVAFQRQLHEICFRYWPPEVPASG
jgi:hypothetical protein